MPKRAAMPMRLSPGCTTYARVVDPPATAELGEVRTDVYVLPLLQPLHTRSHCPASGYAPKFGFIDRMALTVMPYREARPINVSPHCTRYRETRTRVGIT